MFYTAAIIAVILAFCMLLLGIRILFGKHFVHTHIDGNETLNSRGITCVHAMERQERCKNPHAVNERSQTSKQ